MSSVALAACLSALTLASACNQDEPATYLPEPGDWIYEQTTVVGNSCPADVTPEPLSSFFLDYDGGDSFQIELGDEDVVCEIDGTAFTCSDHVYTSEVPGFDALVRWARTWEGDFLSETEAEGNEITRVSCAGTDCNLVDTLPCTVNVSFEASAI